MIVAAHQPHYLPWLGYLAKVAASDLFVIMDDVQYETQNFQNRNRVKLADGPAWLTVPLEHGPQDERILDKRIFNGGSEREHWQRRTCETLRVHYRAARYWSTYADELEAVYTRPWTKLVDLDVHLLTLHLGWLGIDTPTLRASTLKLAGHKTEHILALCRAVGAETYLSGNGASRSYLDVAALEAAGVHVAWQTFRHPIYPQRYGSLGFYSHLAALDLLLNCGPKSAGILRGALGQLREAA